MSDQLDEQLAQAGLALLVADAGLRVHDGVVPVGAATPYALVYTMIERAPAPADRLSGSSTTVTVRWYCHCVGATAAAARAVAMRVRVALLDQRPAVAGLNVGLIRHEQSIPPDRDESTGKPVMDSVQVYRLTATS